MAELILTGEIQSADTTRDGIVIVKAWADIPGGVVLDTTGWGGASVAGIKTLGTITGGSTYTNGSYTDVPLTGGGGVSATANITVAGTVVSAVTIVDAGKGYSVGDVLSAAAANIGGTGTGFSVPVASVQDVPAADTIYAGHGVIQVDATGEYILLPKTGVIPASHTAVGVVKGSVLTKSPAVGVVLGGEVRVKAMEYPVSAAFKTATKNIIYLED